MNQTHTTSYAVFSDDRAYRYTLSRTWDMTLPRMMFIGLNPSTADEVNDDPTIRRCIGFAEREGCGGIVMTNLFAYRATDPRVMMNACKRPIGRDNDLHLVKLARHCEYVVAAWGSLGGFQDRSTAVRNMLKSVTRLLCLGRTIKGEPRHPLYLRSDAKLTPLDSAPDGEVMSDILDPMTWPTHEKRNSA